MAMTPLTPIQRGMLFHHLKSPDSGVDIEQMVATLDEAIDPVALERAWQALTNRHEIFRSRFEWERRDTPVRIVEPAVTLPWIREDWRGLEPDAQERRLDTFLAADRARGFDPAVAPLARGALLQLTDARWIFVWTFHHMLADGQSYAALITEGFRLYDAPPEERPEPEPAPISYTAFTDWLDAHQRAMRTKADAFWRQALAGIAGPTPLPMLRAADDRAAVAHREQTHRLSEDATRRLQTYVQAAGVSLNAAIQAAWSLVLHGASGESDVVFGVTRAGRRSTIDRADEIAGSFINTVPVRVRIDPDVQVTEWLRALRAQSAAIGPFEHASLIDIQRASSVPAGLSLFESLLVFTPRLIGERLREQGGAWTRRDIAFREQTNFPIALFVYGEPSLVLKLTFDANRVSAETITRWLAQLDTILTAMPARPDQRVGDLPVLSDAEHTLVLDAWNATDRPFERDACIHELIEAQATRTPDATALRFRDQSLTYAELNRHANHLASRLRARGVGRGSVVGVFVERSLEMVVALVGIFKAGAAYLPLDPSFPQERLAWMIEDTDSRVILTQSHLSGGLPRHNADVLRVDLGAVSADDDRNARDTADPEDLAYVIFTSGSTGRPKGVMVRHRNVTNFFAGMDDRLAFTTPGTWLAVTSISFDISVLELFWTLSRGFTVVIQEELDKIARTTRSSINRPMDFSLFYFSADASGDDDDRYRLLFDGARYADANGFRAVWTPERHFHAFGGLYPNPAVTSAALAAMTTRLQIRAGSVVLPLHNPIRVAEEWAVVDNISKGRVELSFASGWHTNDFALMPDAYQDRREVMARHIDTVRRLWRGEAVPATNGHGQPIDVRIFPSPRQKAPPIWIAAAGNLDTFTMAGRIGAKLLTNLLGQRVEEVAVKVAAYRQAWTDAGHPGRGHVALMLHTFVGTDVHVVREAVRKPLIDYLKTSTELVKQARWEFPAFANPGKRQGPIDNSDLTDAEVDAMMEHAFERYFQTSGLFGTPETCLAMVDRLKAADIDEIACLLDFGIDTDLVLDSLQHLKTLQAWSQPAADASDDYAIPAQLLRHPVTHLQGTPSLMRTILADADGRRGLQRVRTLMVGGEPLPAALAAELLTLIRGDLLNMYGPTETTVWSTVAPITNAHDITIGRPIANTQIYIADRQGRPAPIGAPGELLIGGEGVTKGYWKRPDLTAERFVPNPCTAAPDLVYRTGDLARYRDDGRIEFLGRIDHQVKIHGHRIELGEIETLLGQHPSIAQSVVAVRSDGGGEPRLVAYVVAKQSGPASGGANASAWQAIWNETYQTLAARPAEDPSFDISGWRSSYTGDAIPRAEMREWVEATVARILALTPRRIVEVGSGTGLLLYRLAPHVEHYTGIDFSAAAIERLTHGVRQASLSNVTLHEGPADALRRLAGASSADVVVINSVAQYFPDVSYLIDVLEQAASIVRPGGAIFVGDVRNLPWLEALHTDIELTQAPATMPVQDLRERIRERIDHDMELVIAPDFFDALRTRIPAITAVSSRLKRGRSRNEMVRFRLDVVLHIGDGARERPAYEMHGAGLGAGDALRTALASPDGIVIRGLRNARVARAIDAVRLLKSESGPATAGELRQAMDAASDGVDPEDLFANDDGLDADVWLSAGGAPDEFDAALRGPAATVATRIAPTPSDIKPWADYVHHGKADSGQLVQTLKQHLRAQLPPYMVPAAFVVMDALPLTPNGKIDRNALPEPDRGRQEAATPYVAPQDDLERMIAETWQDLLAIDRVSTQDNFFDIGANSLLMVQAHSMLREKLGRPLSLVDLFRFPTVSALAGFLVQNAQESAALAGSQARAQTRKDALDRRREGRQAARVVRPSGTVS
ncbi:MAG TPA: MupA/Atu3671 family FMN-dependent luciferase-like monooxygenase [Vicinamibacterales bacterium]|jgi:natural product biosynthesis luciferase-like monooxygenase protein|nr:MupA/Atu3671 family FMN-dependent luciferase-like monooxygenase [Vicinamibacterales bacterium]